MQKEKRRCFFVCTAVKFKKEKALFGRNLDLEYSFGERITFMPREFPLNFRREKSLSTHFSMIGTAYVFEGYPLFYDAVNEHGVFMAALNFPENAVYFQEKKGLYNVAPFELIPWVLGRCSTAKEAAELLKNANILDENFSPELPNTPLHWFVADKEKAYAAEPLSTGISVLENPAEVLTNNPPFDFHLLNLANYMNVSPRKAENNFSEKLMIKPFSRGMGGMGLPGDLSSASRFVRAVFVKENSLCGESEEDEITQFFHILSSVEQQKGCVRLENGELEHTLYSSCATEDGKYFFRTYENSRILCADIKKEHPDSRVLKTWPMEHRQDIRFINQ